MSFDLQINVFTIVFMLMLFLGLQMQVSGLSKKIDELLKR
jgi:hypothetical protein